MVIIGNNEEEISDLKNKLFMEFKMKDLENLKYFFGIGVFRLRKGILINQKKYILDLLAETGKLSSTEAEFRGVAKEIIEILWLKKLLCELNFPPTETCKLFWTTRQLSISQKTWFNMIEQNMWR